MHRIQDRLVTLSVMIVEEEPMSITSPKDFWTGLIYMAVGFAALVLGADYQMGTAQGMGPGYFPKVLAAILMIIGAVSLVRGFMARGTPVGRLSAVPLALITFGCIMFGLLLHRVGLLVSLFLMCFVSALASREYRFEPHAIAGLFALVGLCALIFVKGLGVPMPLLGSWLEPLLGNALPWLR
jgi:hypothetical protein